MFRALALGVVLTVVSGAFAADPIVTWNDVTLQTIRRGKISPPRASRLLALVHVAMHDAVNGGDGRFDAFAVQARRPRVASRSVAAAAAAHEVLVAEVPADAAIFDAALAAALARTGPRRRDAGVAWGNEAAQAVLAARADDGSAAVVPYVPLAGPGHWQPTPPAFAPALLPSRAAVTPFAMDAGDALRADPPPALDSPEYGAAFDEVRRLGRATDSERTAEQTEIALFWNDGAGTVTQFDNQRALAAGRQLGPSCVEARLRPR